MLSVCIICFEDRFCTSRNGSRSGNTGERKWETRPSGNTMYLKGCWSFYYTCIIYAYTIYLNLKLWVGLLKNWASFKDTLTLDQSLLNKTIKFFFKYNTTHTYEFPSCSYRPVIGPEEDYITDVDVVRYTKQHGKNVS